VLAFDVVFRPAKSVSVLYGLGDQLTGRAVLAAHYAVWPRRSPTWTGTWARAAAMAVSSMCPDRDCWRSASTTGRPGRATPCCILI
jgi:hypothetical protein